MKIKISGFSTGAHGNLGDEIILLSASGDVVLRAGDTVEIEAAEHTLAPDVFTGCANCVEFEDCPFRDGYCSAWAPRG